MLPHRRLPHALLVRVRDEARQPGDQKDRVAELVAEAEVGGRSPRSRRPRWRAADARSAPGAPPSARSIARIMRHVLALELQFHRHLKQARCSRVAACATGVRSLAAAAPRSRTHSSTSCLGRLLHRRAAARQRQPLVEKAHARFDVAAVIRTEGQDAGRHASP